MNTNWKHLGPFDYFTISEGINKGHISAWLKGHENHNWGWQYGIDKCVARTPYIWLATKNIVLFGYEGFDDGFEIWFMGFWIIR